MVEAPAFNDISIFALIKFSSGNAFFLALAPEPCAVHYPIGLTP
ncbi:MULTISPECIES: hypothetical protein [unclassified Caballeronia]|jgi:hypothetical protein|nr:MULTISPECIES: hypothetical protein [unclassified Caballeronia]MDR5774669.1 hypothetical protein [Caballeronia sp. LZ002]MDR5850105.1 hypothetical protein [Caballeronia sp. LZ003]